MNFLKLICLSVLIAGTGHVFAKDKKEHKYRYAVLAGAGTYTADRLRGADPMKVGQILKTPNRGFGAGFRYFVSPTIGISVCGFYSQTNYQNSASTNAYDATGNYALKTTTVNASLTTVGLSAECMVIIDKARKNHPATYFLTGLGYGYSSGSGTLTTSYRSLVGTTNYNETSKAKYDRVRGHISILGATGGKALFWYAELGYGYKGVINGGVGYKF